MNYASIVAPLEHLETARKLGLAHPIEAFLCTPDRYEDYRHVLNDFDEIDESAMLAPVLCKVFVVKGSDGKPSLRGYGLRNGKTPKGGYAKPDKLLANDPFGWGVARWEIDLHDARGNKAILSVFRAIGPWRSLEPGQELIIRGSANRNFGSRLRFDHAEPVYPNKIGAIAPVYLGGSSGSNAYSVTQMVHWAQSTDERALAAFSAASQVIRDDCGGLPDHDILDLCTPAGSWLRPESLPELLVSLHSPRTSIEEGRLASAIAAKICALGLQCRAQRQNTRAPSVNAPIGKGLDLAKMVDNLIVEVETRKGYPLTGNQKTVIKGIVDRLPSELPLNGLLSGEVGSGKTMSYALPAVVAHQSGARVAIMAPTVLLADQIANGIAKDFDGLATVERVKANSKIRNPNAILVGTIGLNTVAKKNGYVPDFLILDEQHKLHLAGRESMVQPSTHTLDVSATPIPRSLALSLYEGMDLFVLNEQPVKREIHTALLDVKDRGIVQSAIVRALREGKRCAIVFTLVEPHEGTPAASVDAPVVAKRGKDEKESDAKALKTAIDSAALFEKHFPGQVALLHGQMSDKEKIDALNEFKSGSKSLMITTTIFETGIDVADVGVLVVRDPQQLGLSQLHQLRGRLARNGGAGVCFLLTEDLEALSQESYDRLNVFCNTLDGYALAHSDMIARGAGDLDGLQQKGKASTTFKCIKMTTHDLLLNEGNRSDLSVKAEAVVQEQVRANRQQQASLF